MVLCTRLSQQTLSRCTRTKYKHSEYQRCLQLSTQNVHTLIGADSGSRILSTYSEFIQLMDDDLVCLTGLTLLADPSCRKDYKHIKISQLTLSLYLMTQCHMKLHHAVTSLAQTLDYIKVARRKLSGDYTLDQLLLKLSEQKILRYVLCDAV